MRSKEISFQEVFEKVTCKVLISIGFKSTKKSGPTTGFERSGLALDTSGKETKKKQ